MRTTTLAIACFLLILVNSVTALRAESLMSLYRTTLAHFPSIRAFEYKEQALRKENSALGWQRLIDMDAAANYGHLSTKELGRYADGDLSLVNTFDIFNKKGLDRAINSFEIQKNRSLTDLEKKNLFGRLTDVYFSVLKNGELCRIHQESLDWIEKNILLVNAGVEKGAFPATEISRWTIEKLSRQNSVQADKLELARAGQTLRTLTGLESVEPDSLDPALPDSVSAEFILLHSPELTVYEMEIKQLGVEISRENRGQLPDLQLGNSLVLNHEPESTGDQYVATASLSFKLFDGGRRYRVESIKARLAGLESERSAVRATLEEFYRNKSLELQAQGRMLQNLETACSLSTDNLDKLARGYRQRFIDFTTLLNAFRDDVALREGYENTRCEYDINCQVLYHLSTGDIYF